MIRESSGWRKASGSDSGGFWGEKEREGGEKRVVRKKGGQRRDCGIVRGKLEREGGF